MQFVATVEIDRPQ
ncbi:Protein of unknown function [Propionibacterium freudenreichii]|nr:Protein of unknown function [Propionibacterium freudenreichii]